MRKNLGPRIASPGRLARRQPYRRVAPSTHSFLSPPLANVTGQSPGGGGISPRRGRRGRSEVGASAAARTTTWASAAGGHDDVGGRAVAQASATGRTAAWTRAWASGGVLGPAGDRISGASRADLDWARSGATPAGGGGCVVGLARMACGGAVWCSGLGVGLQAEWQAVDSLRCGPTGSGVGEGTAGPVWRSWPVVGCGASSEDLAPTFRRCRRR